MSKEPSECKCVCHVSTNECCERCKSPLVNGLIKIINEDLGLLTNFYSQCDKRLSTIEDLFAGKTFKPIHDAMELHVERFNDRINSLEHIIDSSKHLIDHSQEGIEKCLERIEKLESDHLDQLSPEAFVILKKEIDEMKANVFFNKDNRHDLNQSLSAIQKEYLELFEVQKCRINFDIDAVGRLCDVEKTISELVDKIADLCNHYYRERKEPFKCPVCSGHGGQMDIICRSCEGTGVLWK